MICSLCDESNPEANRFCGNCGATLDIGGQKLRQQIVTIIGQEFKDQEMIAASVGKQVADRAEDRFWQWAKILGFAGAILGFAMTVFLAGLGFFGFTSYKEAQSRIDSASQVAITNFNHASEQSIANLHIVAKQTEQTIVQTGSETTSQMQQQAGTVFSKAKASRGELDRANQEVARLEDQIAAFKKIHDQLPDTPIGNISNNLFVPSSNQGQELNGTTLLGSGLNSKLIAQGYVLESATVTPPYKEGATGPGVTKLQARLAELGCYQGQPSGTFDPDTAKAVIAFDTAYGRGLPSGQDVPFATSEVPSPLIFDSEPGAVDYKMWWKLFSSTAKKCQ